MLLVMMTKQSFVGLVQTLNILFKMAKDENNTIIPLTQSYRIPVSVHTLATKLAQSISTKNTKRIQTKR